MFSSFDKRSAILAELLALEYTFYLMIGRVGWLDHMVANVATEVDQDLSATAAIVGKQRVTWLVLLFEQQKYFPLFFASGSNFSWLFEVFVQKMCYDDCVRSAKKPTLGN